MSAIFGVILIHACGEGFYAFGKIPHAQWLAVNFLDSMVRCSVPLFVMISGALLLKRDRQPSTVGQLGGRIWKVLAPLLVWSAVYLWYVAHYTGAPIDWLSIFSRVPMYHLWFVYMIIGLYLLLPVWQAVFQCIVARRDLQIYLLVCWIVVTCVPVHANIPLLALLQQTSLLGYGGYFLMGGLVAASGTSRVPALVWWGAYCMSVAITFFATWYASKEAGAVVETAYLYFSLNVLAASFSAFALFLRARPGRRAAVVLHWASDKCFLVFFMHTVVLERVQIQVSAMQLPIPLVVTVLLNAVLTIALCLAIAAVVRMVPRSRAIVG